ncbi:NDR1/HIN1-like protein 3 [Malania oleifera]|uniref:NDR1/HIN1-like protein 3 n=1 Tax=Malania oleifera TaxID=397392 RepID=UPI0025AEBA50|nr:NDR1/HIN1-like protein 3 [Malania oleifera]
MAPQQSPPQPYLNGAFYGPAVPPPQKSHRHASRGGGCCCGCCLLNLLFKLLITLIVTIGIVILVLWLVFRPNKVKFHVTDASLSQFNFSSANNSLRYNLSLTTIIRNPNKRIAIYYDRVEANTYYEDQMFGAFTAAPFYQGHKNTTTLNMNFDGQTSLPLGASEVSDLNSEKSEGVYSIDLKLYLRVRFKYGPFKSPKLKPKIKCDLKIPMSGTGAATFQTTKCDVDF